MDYNELVEKMIVYVGGNGNIVSYMSCMTRLRIEVADIKKVDVAKLEGLDKVKGVVVNGQYVQVVLLKELDAVYDAFDRMVSPQAKASKKKTVFNTVMTFLQSVFIPMVPALMGGGLLLSLFSVLTSFQLIDTNTTTYTVLNVLANAAFYYFPILTAVSTARALNLNPYICVVVAGIMIHPDIVGLSALESGYYDFLGISIKAVDYTSSIFPVLLSLFVVKGLDIVTRKVIPNDFRTLLAPFLILLIGVPICLWLVAPVGAIIADAIFNFVNFLYTASPALTGLVIGATATLFVLTGVHTSLIIITIMNLSTLGYDWFFPLLHFSNMILTGIAFGVWLRLKDKEQKAYAFSSFLVALISGTAEPTLYGIVVRYKRPFITVVSIGAIMGLSCMLLNVTCTGIANGLIGMPLFVANFPQYLVVLVISLIGSAVLTYILNVEEE